MSTRSSYREKNRDHEELKTSETDSGELLELLKLSVAPPAGDDEDARALDDGRLTFTSLDRAEMRQSLSSYVPGPSRRLRSGPFLVGLTVSTAFVALGFGALAWFDRPEQARVDGKDADASARADLEQRNQELIAMRAAHQETIAKLEQRLAEIGGGGQAGAEESREQLAAKLEEVRAESFELEVEAAALEDQRGARRHASRGGPSGSAGEPWEPRGARARLDENPYDGVTSATNLNNTVWARDAADAEAAPEEPASGPSAVDALIESAVRGPTARGSGSSRVDDPRQNSLAESDQASLPDRPARSAVRQVLGSLNGTVRRCGGEPYDRLVVELTVAGSTGRVTSARTVDAAHAGTPVGACAARAVKLARFPRFEKDQVVIKYPFEL